MGVHASSIPTSARLIFHMEIQQVRKQLVIRCLGVRGKVGLRTTWTILDATCVENVLVRTGHTINRLTIEWRGGENKKRNPVLFTKDRTPI